MIYFKSCGVLLYRKTRRESDEIIAFYSPHKGKILCSARGSKKSKRRFLNALQPGNLCEIEYSFRSSPFFYHLDEVSVMKRFIPPACDLERFYLFSFILESFYRLTHPGVSSKRLFRLLLFSLHIIANLRSQLKEPFLVWFIANFLRLEGLGASFLQCARCGKNIKKGEKYWISPPSLLVCENCLREEKDKIEIYSEEVYELENFILRRFDEKAFFLRRDILKSIFNLYMTRTDFALLLSRKFILRNSPHVPDV